MPERFGASRFIAHGRRTRRVAWAPAGRVPGSGQDRHLPGHRFYESVSTLCPAAVFLDDIDLLAGDRRHGTSGPELGEFLTHLDGFTPPSAVVTVATTNDVNAIDSALLRPGRFDSVIEVRPPGRVEREAILHHYLDALGEFDASKVAVMTQGATGAELREIVRRGVLEYGSALTEDALVELVRSARWKPEVPAGQYL